jgi:hypothetical protein
MLHRGLAREQEYQPAVLVSKEMIDQARRSGRAGTIFTCWF